MLLFKFMCSRTAAAARFLVSFKASVAAAIFAVAGFICVMFTYIGVNTFLPGVHSYA